MKQRHRVPSPAPFSLVAAVAALALAAGCSSTKDAVADDSLTEWVHASPILRQQIEDEAKRLPWTHGFERLEQIRWFASVGEPAYPKLLELAVDPSDDVAAAALAALGATQDRRLVPHVRGLRFSAEREQADIGLERARTLVRLGDWSEIPVLIRGLTDQRLYTRALCLDALSEATHETHGFDPRAGERERERAVKLWNEWWEARVIEGMLGR